MKRCLHECKNRVSNKVQTTGNIQVQEGQNFDWIRLKKNNSQFLVSDSLDKLYENDEKSMEEERNGSWSKAPHHVWQQCDGVWLPMEQVQCCLLMMWLLNSEDSLLTFSQMLQTFQVQMDNESKLTGTPKVPQEFPGTKKWNNLQWPSFIWSQPNRVTFQLLKTERPTRSEGLSKHLQGGNSTSVDVSTLHKVTEQFSSKY